MLLELTPDQEVFRETTARFLEQRAPVAELRRRRDDAVAYDPSYWRQAAELGWTSLLVDEGLGGGSITEHGLVDLTLVAHEVGRRAAPGPLVPTNVVAGALAGDERHHHLLSGLLDGSSIATWCLAEGPPHSGLGEVGLQVRVDGGEVVLDGRKRPVEAAAEADHLLVTGRTGTGLTQVVVPVDTPGVTITPLRGVDLTRRYATVGFDGVRVPGDAVVGQVGKADEDVERQLDQALVLVSAETVGALQTAFDMTVEWAFDRYSFGRPLASYQAIKHRVATMKVVLEASHAIADEAAAAVAAGTADAGRLASAAKAYTGANGADLMQECVQLHGGIGVTFEHDLHLYLRRVTADRMTYGTPAEHRRRLAAHLAHDDEELPVSDVEDLDALRQRARTFVRSELRLASSRPESTLRSRPDEEELAEVARDREIQRMLFDADLAGVCVPTAFGGQGLTPAHQRVLDEDLRGYEYPVRLQVPTFTPCLSVLLDFGTDEQKQRHVPAILRGDEIWMQFLSEPSGGSDVAGALTTAVRDGDEWVLNGSKVWTTGAWWSDWGLCLARTNWDVPKHRGLSVFMFPIDSEGIEVQRIEMLNGNREFCQEYLTDLRVPDHDRVGGVDDGWTVGTRWMFHERMAHNSPLVTMPAGTTREGIGGAAMRSIARDAGRLDDPTAQEMIGEAEGLDLVSRALRRRIGQGIVTGTMSDQSSAIGRLFMGTAIPRRTTIQLGLAGSAGAAWADDDGELVDLGTDYLMRQSASIGGGTTEMAANVISERVLGMPRESSRDRDVAFRDVPRSSTSP